MNVWDRPPSEPPRATTTYSTRPATFTPPAWQRAAALQRLCLADAPDARKRCEASTLDPAPPPRKAACQALRLSGDAAPWMQGAFADPLPKVQKLAVLAAGRGTPLADPPAFVDWAVAHGTHDALARPFGLLKSAPLWTRLHWLLHLTRRLAATPHAGLCHAALRSWLRDHRHHSRVPADDTAERLRALWEAMQAGVPDPLRQALAFHLKTFKVIPPRAAAHQR